MNPTIVIVEDEIIIARELEARLEGLGYDVVGIASSAGEGVRLAVEKEPDLVLMDIVLKGERDGIEAAAEIRRRCQVPVIYLTAYTDEGTLGRARVTEPFGYIVKPFSERELHANIEMALYKHRNEMRLRRLEDWFGTAIEEVADAVIVADRDGVITDFNAAAEAITDWDREEAVGRRMEDVFRLVDRATGEPIALASAAEGPLARMATETRLIDRSDRRIPVDSTTSVIRDDRDRPAGLVSVFRDPTGRRHGALAALSRDVALTAQAHTLRGTLQSCAEALVRHLHAALACIWILDEAGGTLVMEASAGQFARLEGPHRGVPVGQALAGWIAEERAPYVTNDVADEPRLQDPDWALREGMTAFAGYPLVAGGRLVGVMELFSKSRLHPTIQDALAGVADAVAVAVERKQAEEALRTELRHTSRKLARTTAASPAILYTMELVGEALVPAWISDNVTRILGYEVDEALGPEWWLERLHPEDREGRLAQVPALLAEGHLATEFRFLRKDGTVAWIRDHSRVERGEGGDIEQIVGAWLDVTERHEVEEQLLQAQKMESVGRLAGGIAHDFNNLLTVITGTSDFVLEDMTEDDRLRADLLEIRSAAERATALTRQLLAFSRKQISQPRVLDLNAVLAGTETMLRRLIREDIGLTVSPDPALGNVRADPGQIEQVVLNLVVNARDSMSEGGTLSIETANVGLDDTYARQHPGVEPGPCVMLAVSDTGTGMDEATRQRVFEPFFTTKGAAGTGLGLSTVYGIVKQSGGTVLVYSEPGVGSTFKVYLPRVTEPVDEVREVGAGEARGGTETILLVEDDASVRELVRRALESMGYEVLTVADARDAEGLARDHRGPVHLLLTDVVMPEMQGPELARRIQAAHPEAKVLFMSGYTPEAIERHGVLAPGAHLLSKPFDLETLTRKLRQALDGAG